MRKSTHWREAVTRKLFHPSKSLTALPIMIPSAATHCNRAMDVVIIRALNSCLE